MDAELHKAMRNAIKRGDLNEFVRLVGNDVSRLEMMTPFGTWLHVAAAHDQLDITKWLLDHGANVNQYGGIAGGGALQVAASDGHYEIVKYLLDNGAELDVSAPERNPLFGAILGGHEAIAKLLIDRGIDTRVRYSGESMKGMDAIAFAHERGQSGIAELLEANHQDT